MLLNTFKKVESNKIKNVSYAYERTIEGYTSIVRVVGINLKVLPYE